jgi:Ca-activated chloride channel family protein
MLLPFARPLLLVLLAVPVWLIVRNWRRQSGHVVLPFDHGPQRSSRFLGGLVHAAELLPPCILAVVILLLAGPQQLAEPKSRKELTNIEFCVDISGSMGSLLGEATRYDAAMEAINRFVDYREGDAFGLTFFGNSYLHWTPLTSDVSAIKCATPFMGPRKNIRGFGGTEIGKAVIACRKLLMEREEGDRMIVLVSDGYSSDLGGGRSAQIASDLKAENVVVHAIHIAESEVPDEIVNLCGLTGGEVFGVGDPQALEQVFHHIDQMHQTKVVQLAPDTIDDFAPYCMTGLSLLAAAVLCLFGIRFAPW